MPLPVPNLSISAQGLEPHEEAALVTVLVCHLAHLSESLLSTYSEPYTVLGLTSGSQSLLHGSGRLTGDTLSKVEYTGQRSREGVGEHWEECGVSPQPHLLCTLDWP